MSKNRRSQHTSVHKLEAREVFGKGVWNKGSTVGSMKASKEEPTTTTTREYSIETIEVHRETKMEEYTEKENKEEVPGKEPEGGDILKRLWVKIVPPNNKEETLFRREGAGVGGDSLFRFEKLYL